MCECQARDVCQQGRLTSRLLGTHFSAVDGRIAVWTVIDVLVGSLFVNGIILAANMAVTEGLPAARSDGGVGLELLTFLAGEVCGTIFSIEDIKI